MMYVKLMRIFHLSDSNNLMPVRLISASLAERGLILLSRHDVRRVHEKFSSRRFEEGNSCLSHFGILSPKTCDSKFVDRMCVEFMKNFFLAHSNKLMAVGHISAS